MTQVRTQVRLPEAVHTALVRRAKGSGRTLNGELVECLERALEDQGDDVAGRLGRALVTIMTTVGEIASYRVPGRPHWADDLWAYRRVRHAIMKLLDHLAPEGPLVRPEPSERLVEGLIDECSDPDEARQLAERMIDQMVSDHIVDSLTSQGQGDFYAGARAFQDKLGSKLASRLVKEESK